MALTPNRAGNFRFTRRSKVLVGAGGPNDHQPFQKPSGWP